MPAVNPKRLPVNFRRNSPARRMTPQEMRAAVAELKNKAPAPSTRPQPVTPNRGENTGIKTATVGDEVYKAPAPVAPQQPKPPQMDYVPGPGGTKMPISGGNRGVTPLPGPGLIGIPEATPEAIAAGKAIDARKGAMNPPGSYTPPAGINMPGMRASAPPRTPQQMMKKGGQAKAYASGGSVKGAGIAQRGVRKCKMV